ncbi:Protein transport protein Sec24 [Gracilaria domingensis]|nr:Protein transport protein Sec24 [Gracilaria domingensis]
MAGRYPPPPSSGNAYAPQRNQQAQQRWPPQSAPQQHAPLGPPAPNAVPNAQLHPLGVTPQAHLAPNARVPPPQRNVPQGTRHSFPPRPIRPAPPQQAPSQGAPPPQVQPQTSYAAIQPQGYNAKQMQQMQQRPATYTQPGSTPYSQAAMPQAPSQRAAPPSYGSVPSRPVPHMQMRPAPPTTAMQNMSLQQRSAPPPGMRAAPVTDARLLPRPDMNGPAVASRISMGDPVPNPPLETAPFPDPITGQATPRMAVEPAACPPDVFVPVSNRVVRLCNTAFPTTVALAKKYSLPLGAIIQPLAMDKPVPVVNFGGAGIVRCRRCRSYINFSCSFKEGGRRWLCSMCGFTNDVPSDYFSPLDQNGKRRDAAQRPELCQGSVEFVAPAEYMVRPPMPPVYLFVLETTPASANSGALNAAVAGIKKSINSMPNEGRTRVGIITFDSAVHFYRLSAGEDSEPAIYVISDINDIFLPTPESIMVQLSECRPCFERALDMIAQSDTQMKGVASAPSCLGAAIKGAQKALEYSGGKMLIFAASRPTVGPGSLRERGDSSYLGTDQERAVLRPDSSIYSQVAVQMSKYQISCDMFLCPPPSGHFLDVPTLAPLVKFTGGELFFSPNFDAPKDAPRLQLAINRVLARETGLEAVMRIRATKSVRCVNFSGRFFLRSADLLALPNVDADKAYAVQFQFEDSSVGEGPFCLQVALLYTTTTGERRIRVHTSALPVTSSLSDLFMRVDAPATVNIFARQAAEGMKDRGLEEMKKNQLEKVINALVKYREVCQTQYPAVSGNGQLLLPDAMVLLPLYMHGLSKTPVLSRDASGAFLYKFDDKAYLTHSVDVMNASDVCAFVYPNIIPVYPWPSADETLIKHPNGAPATVSMLKSDVGVVIDDGRSLILWLGSAVLQRFTSELLGKAVSSPVDPRFLAVEVMRRGHSAKGPISQVCNTINSILAARKPFIPFHVVPAGDQRMQPRVEALMVEDRTASSHNYREFLLELQRRISHATARR